jgi:hypothetical protein
VYKSLNKLNIPLGGRDNSVIELREGDIRVGKGGEVEAKEG